MGKCIFENKVPFKRFGIMYDNSRIAVMTVDMVKRMIDIMESLGYNMLSLYTEETYEVYDQPYFGHLRGRFTREELKEIDSYAKEHGVELVPCIQTLAHFHCLMYWKEYEAISDCNDILCVGEEKVYKLIDDIFRTLAECFTSRFANIGMDEAFMVGLGKYLRKHGYENRIDILKRHLERVSEIAAAYGFTVCMWSDMFFQLANGGYHEKECGDLDISVSQMIPDNVRLVYWDYDSTDKAHYDKWIEGHQKLKEDSLFAGGLWGWTGFVPHNVHSIKAGLAATQSCIEHQVEDVFYTVWGDNGSECSRYAVLPSMFYNACIAHGVTDETEIKEKFEALFGIAFDDFMLVDLPGTANTTNPIGDPDKYQLFADCFMGKFDSNVRKEDGELYGQMAGRLEPFVSHPEFGRTFHTLKTLCEVLELKFNIGVRTREAYLSGDKSKLRELLPVYEELIIRMERFYDAFREQWLYENKPIGLEVHDTRLGGLIWRIKSCRRILQDYLNGKQDCIIELEQPVLDFTCRRDIPENEEKKAFLFNSWGASVTASII